METGDAPHADVVACYQGSVHEVHRYLSKLTAGDRALAEDLTQETYWPWSAPSLRRGLACCPCRGCSARPATPSCSDGDPGARAGPQAELGVARGATVHHRHPRPRRPGWDLITQAPTEPGRFIRS
jgi:hypothetical protein